MFFLYFYQSDDTHHMLRNPYRISKELITEEKVDWSDHDKYSSVFLSHTFRCVLLVKNTKGFVTKREICTVKYRTEVIRRSTGPKSGPLEKNFSKIFNVF